MEEITVQRATFRRSRRVQPSGGKDASASSHTLTASQRGGKNLSVVPGTGVRDPQAVQLVLREIIVYMIFLVLFTAESARDLTDPDIYRFGSGIKEQITGESFLPRHSPTHKSSLEDVSTLLEVKRWLQGPLLTSVFSEASIDGDARSAKYAGQLFGVNKILGAVRVASLRVRADTCDGSVPSVLAHAGQKYKWVCYGGASGSFATERENRNDFGVFADHPVPGAPANTSAVPYGPFVFSGRDGITGAAVSGDVDGARTAVNVWYSRSMRSYPAPAYAVLIDPTRGMAAAKRALDNLVLSHYVDLQTRALFVDFSVYNPMVDRTCWTRVAFEMTKAGGVVSSLSHEVVRVWSRSTAMDNGYVALFVIVGLFYLYFAYQELLELRSIGWREYCTDSLNLLQLLNVVLFAFSAAFRFSAPRLVPDINVDVSDQFYDMYPAVRMMTWSVVLQACNVFLNWFKLIAYLSYAPTFAIMNTTISKSAKGVSGFVVIFCILLYGFAQAHAMVFAGRIASFSTLGTTLFTLLRSLLGDFDFEEMQAGHSVMGPLFFVAFVVLCVFVVLNMFIAIISDAYTETIEESVGKPNINLGKEIRQFVWMHLQVLPCAGRYLRAARNQVRRLSMSVSTSLSRDELAALRVGTPGAGTPGAGLHSKKKGASGMSPTNLRHSRTHARRQSRGGGDEGGSASPRKSSIPGIRRSTSSDAIDEAMAQAVHESSAAAQHTESVVTAAVAKQVARVASLEVNVKVLDTAVRNVGQKVDTLAELLTQLRGDLSAARSAQATEAQALPPARAIAEMASSTPASSAGALTPLDRPLGHRAMARRASYDALGNLVMGSTVVTDV
eukprot:g2378.t1